MLRTPRTTPEKAATSDARRLFKAALDELVADTSISTFDAFEARFLSTMQAFDELVATGLTGSGDRNNGKGDFVNDVLVGYLNMPAVRGRLSRAADVAGRGLAMLAERRQSLLDELGPYVLAPLTEPTLVTRLASTLAVTATPLTLERAAAAVAAPPDAVLAALVASPIFRHAGAGWGLGRECPPSPFYLQRDA